MKWRRRLPGDIRQRTDEQWQGAKVLVQTWQEHGEHVAWVEAVDMEELKYRRKEDTLMGWMIDDFVC